MAFVTQDSLATDSENVTSNLPSTNSPLYPYTPARIVVGSIWALIGVLGLLGNSFVIFSVVLSKKPRTITNVFVVNLSVADFWTSLSYPWQAVAVLSKHGWPLPTEVPCILTAVQFYTGLGASLFSLSAIAFNRFMLITRTPQTYKHWYSPRKVACMVAVTWVVPFVVFFFPPIIGVGDFGYDAQDNTCSDIDAHPRGAEYNLAQSLGLFPLPMLIIITCYAGLYIHLRRHFEKQKTRTQHPTTPREETSTVENSTLSFTLSSTASAEKTASILRRRRQQKINRQQIAITKSLFVVFCVFVALIPPYFISIATGPGARKFALYGATIMISNTVVNPFIYAVSHPQFKVVLRKMICCRFSEIPEPSDWLKSVLGRN